MRPQIPIRLAMSALGVGLLALALACGGSTSTSTYTTAVPMGKVITTVSDASTEDWAQIGVKVLGITLTPQGGGTPVTLYTAPTPAPVLNLCQLDQLSELIGSLSVPAGTYTKATLTIAANPGDVTLVSSSSPEVGFPIGVSTAVDPSLIQIKNTTGTAPNLTTTVAVNLVNPLVVVAGQTSAMDLEFDLSHPAFVVEHVPLAGSVTWAVNFNGPVRHHPHYDLTQVVLRHLYASVTSVSTDYSSLDLVKDHEVYPIPGSGPAPIASLQTLSVLADATNGTLFYDLDATPVSPSVVHDFSAQAATLAGKYVRVAARHQSNGSLTAVRVWASSSWAKVWISPEGHVNHVTASQIDLDNENGLSVPITVDANTKFYFRTPASGLSDATPIGTGPTFLANLARGFKVHVSLVDPLATSNLTAATVDIEIAKFDGVISNATVNGGFTYTRKFFNAADNYSMPLAFCADTTANGKDAAGNPILGFKWWNFAFPTLADTGASAKSDFVTAVSGSVNFNGTVGALSAWGMSYAVWGDPANTTGWSTKWAILEPTRLPRGTVSSPFAANAFGMTLTGGANPVTVNLSATPGSATLVYDVSTSGLITTITPVDITTPAGQTFLTTYVANGGTVRVWGVPQPGGTIKCYALNVVH